MKIKPLLLSIIAGLFTVVVTGCGSHDHDGDAHSHDSVKHEADKTNATTHDTIK